MQCGLCISNFAPQTADSQVLPKTLNNMDDMSSEAPDTLTRQLETYLNHNAAKDSSAKPVMNPMMTATVIRARMALSQAVNKMLAAAKEERLAQLGGADGTSVQVGSYTVYSMC